MVNFTLPSTTNEMVSISTSQTFRSSIFSGLWRFYLSTYTIRLGLLLVWMFHSDAQRLSSKLLKQGYLAERLQSSFRKFYGRYGDFILQYEVSLSWMLNDILTLDQKWLPDRSIPWPSYRAWPSPNYEWFPWSICNGCGMPAGNAYPSGHLVPSPFFGDLLVIQLLRPDSSNLPCPDSTFHLEYPLILSRFRSVYRGF